MNLTKKQRRALESFAAGQNTRAGVAEAVYESRYKCSNGTIRIIRTLHRRGLIEYTGRREGGDWWAISDAGAALIAVAVPS